MAALQEREMRILAFERRMWRSPGAKELQIREDFAISATRYYQLLNELIDRPEAAAFDPALVNRLRARRSRRASRGLCVRRNPMNPAETGAGPAGRDQRRPGPADVPAEFLPRTPAGRAGLAALLSDPEHALIGLDFDGTLAPIVMRPRDARVLPGRGRGAEQAGPAGRHAGDHHRPAGCLRDRGGRAGRRARPRRYGHYGWERWRTARSPRCPPRPASPRRAASCPSSSLPPARRPAPGPRTRGTRWRYTPGGPLILPRRCGCCGAPRGAGRAGGAAGAARQDGDRASAARNGQGRSSQEFGFRTRFADRHVLRRRSRRHPGIRRHRRASRRWHTWSRGVQRLGRGV